MDLGYCNHADRVTRQRAIYKNRMVFSGALSIGLLILFLGCPPASQSNSTTAAPGATGSAAASPSNAEYKPADNFSWGKILVAVLGWAGVQLWTIYHDTKARKHSARIGRLKNQIEELYGPLIGINRQSDAIFKIAAKILPHSDDGQIAFNKFDPQNKDNQKWSFFVEKYFIPLNREAVSLLKTKAHLIDDPVPPSFAQFITHAMQLEALHTMWAESRIETHGAAGLGFPPTFNSDVENRFNDGRSKYQEALREYDV